LGLSSAAELSHKLNLDKYNSHWKNTIHENQKMAANAKHPGYVSVTPLLKQLATLTGALQATPKDIAAAVTLVFEDRISPIQFSLLLWALHTTGMDHNPEVLASTAKYMRHAAAQVDRNALRSAIAAKAKPEGNYRGGLVSFLGLASTYRIMLRHNPSVTLLVLAATATTPSTSPPPLPSWPVLSS
jgi:hypothetical protein